MESSTLLKDTMISTRAKIYKLYMPRCTGLTAEGVVKIVQVLYECKGNLNRIRLHGICRMTKHHLDAISSAMCKGNQQEDDQSLFYSHRVHEVLNTNDERRIDVDVCPMCTNVRLVFDCTRDGCRRKDSWAQCRGCFFCVARCETCGGCIDLEELSETELACSDFLCMECWLPLPKCSTCNRPYCKRHENLKASSSECAQHDRLKDTVINRHLSFWSVLYSVWLPFAPIISEFK
ncbi:hypothetical protein OsJ_27392 [Oryza sativa Japonica Group]|uniref:Uncharacterized protein n=1 Tax=Oryza sativa subsp. japonica TaxID=39947 RepID=B9G107_ORYSJ|nr:hypothetical protein OsJ_27392 [Oryza sativa Japonica Group]